MQLPAAQEYQLACQRTRETDSEFQTHSEVWREVDARRTWPDHIFLPRRNARGIAPEHNR
jgi:hypothetical protein